MDLIPDNLWVGVSLLHGRSTSSRWSSISLLFWGFQQFSYYNNSGELFFNTSADNWIPPASNHVTDTCRQSIKWVDGTLVAAYSVRLLSLAALLSYFFCMLFFALRTECLEEANPHVSGQFICKSTIVVRMNCSLISLAMTFLHST